MKKLGKLLINTEKVIKKEDLVNLKGGYGGEGVCTVTCDDSNGNTIATIQSPYYCDMDGCPYGTASAECHCE